MMQIIIWDNEVDRISEIDKNLHLALKELHVRAIVTINPEPPSIAREQLLQRLPVIEINEKYWSLKPGKAFSKRECISLLRQII
jgi:hypothetical protein